MHLRVRAAELKGIKMDYDKILKSTLLVMTIWGGIGLFVGIFLPITLGIIDSIMKFSYVPPVFLITGEELIRSFFFFGIGIIGFLLFAILEVAGEILRELEKSNDR